MGNKIICTGKVVGNSKYIVRTAQCTEVGSSKKIVPTVQFIEVDISKRLSIQCTCRVD